MVWMNAHDSMIVSSRNARPGSAKVSALVAISSQAKHRADARAGADDGEHEDGEAAFVLGQILPVNLSTTPLWAIIQNARMR